ncbi:MAG: PAS domain S-box protein [Balneolales bacterium]
MIRTLAIGPPSLERTAIEKVLTHRKHVFFVYEKFEQAINGFETVMPELVLLTDTSEKALQFCKFAKSSAQGKSLTILVVLQPKDLGQIHELIDAEVDECIIESIFHEDRLDARIAFAERQVMGKSQRRNAENKLRLSEAHARSILETTVDAIITIDKVGTIRSFNPAAERLFGYSADEVIGSNVKILMPDPYRKEHDDYLRNYMNTGYKKIIGLGREVSGKRKDGTVFPMYLAVSEVKLSDQRIFTGIVRDISDQRRLEQEILRISEHERQRIGQDLHDGLGQMLTGIGLISQNIARELQKENSSQTSETEEITKLIREADQYARNLARGLIPVEFDSHGLSAALKRLSVNAQKLFNITCNFTEINEVYFEDTATITHLFRIAQEAVSNAVKHGKADTIEIFLDGSKDHLYLQVTDNGTGFPEKWEKDKGLGVRIMQFRARLIGADLDIKSKKNGGTVISCKLLDMAYPENYA